MSPKGPLSYCSDVSGNCLLYTSSESDDIEMVGEIVSESERVMGCKGVETNVYQLEREYEERLGEYGGQRAIFPCDISGVKTPHVFYEDEGSSSSFVGDMVSPNGPLSFCGDIPGKARY